MLFKAIRYGLLGGAAYGAYEGTRLSRLYPVQVTTYPRAIASAFPDGVGASHSISTTITPAHPVSVTDFLQAFYSGPAMGVVRFMAANTTGFPAAPPNATGETYTGGIFHVVYKDPATAVVYWADADVEKMPMWGAQVLQVTREGSKLRLTFGSANHLPPKLDRRVMEVLHNVYARWHLDRAARILEG